MTLLYSDVEMLEEPFFSMIKFSGHWRTGGMKHYIILPGRL